MPSLCGRNKPFLGILIHKYFLPVYFKTVLIGSSAGIKFDILLVSAYNFFVLLVMFLTVYLVFSHIIKTFLFTFGSVAICVHFHRSVRIRSWFILPVELTLA